MTQMTQYYLVHRVSGRVDSAVMSRRPRAELEADVPTGYRLTAEDEMDAQTLEAYQWWSQRP